MYRIRFFISVFLFLNIILFSAGCASDDENTLADVAEDAGLVSGDHPGAVTQTYPGNAPGTADGSPRENSYADPGNGNPAYGNQASGNPAYVNAYSENAICVYVCGCVENPGVYYLPKGSRAVDALDAAGGLTEDADRAGVNLAQVLSDSEMIYFPKEGEAAAYEKQAGLVNINSADVKALSQLPGIGESKALSIIEYRENSGPFNSPEDIKNVPGIGDALYEKIKDLICV